MSGRNLSGSYGSTSNEEFANLMPPVEEYCKRKAKKPRHALACRDGGLNVNNEQYRTPLQNNFGDKFGRSLTNSSSISINYIQPALARPSRHLSRIGMDTLHSSGQSPAGSSNTSKNHLTRAPLNLKQKSLVAMLIFANVSMAVVYSCIGPFFPSEAHNKGATQTEVGLIFGIFELVRCISSPIHGKIIPATGAKFMYIIGILGTSICLILFGLLEYCPGGTTFVILCFAVRITEAVFAAALVTSSFSITAHEFPDRVAVIFGFLETAMGIGYAVGPPLGGLLFQWGGFKLPFFVLGALLFLAGILSNFVVPPQKDSNEPSPGGFFSLLLVPIIPLMCFTASSTSLIFGFYDSSFELHLESFNLTPLVVGLVFLVLAAVYAICAPVIGNIVDRYYKCVPCLMLTGSIFLCIGMLFMGPAPFLNLQKSLTSIILSCALLGFGCSFMFIPTFPMALHSAKAHGYPDNFHTFGAVAGLLQGFFSFGAFIGPVLLGGYSMENLGFGWTSTIISGELLILVVCLSTWCIYLFVKPNPLPEFDSISQFESDLASRNNLEKQPLLETN